MASPARPSRRAVVSRRQVVVESDEEDDGIPLKEESEEEFTPVPRTARHSARRKPATDTVATPKTVSRIRRTASSKSAFASQLLTPNQDISFMGVSESAKRDTSPKKRTGRLSVRANRKARASTAAQHSAGNEVVSSLPPPDPSEGSGPVQHTSMDIESSVKPRSGSRGAIPLADITEQVKNVQESPAQIKQQPQDVTMIDARHTKLETPMNIVIRTRQAAVSTIQEQPTTKSRLVITYLILTNFKSYAGRQEVGPFHASFSSVVGPNGSGKSNVIDSLLFVFGFRASKMRQSKLSALIHNSAHFPNLEFCEVEVQFQEVMDLPTGGLEVVPDSTVVISRRAFKNNSSSYYINAKTSNFTAVTTLLMSRGIDLDHKRFLILQGEIESIAQMKPKAANEHEDGLLEYLEDIIGTSKYKTPIEEAAQDTEELNEVCREMNDRVRHVENEKNGLEEKKDAALAYIRDENTLRGYQSALYQVHAQQCGDSLEASQEAVARIQQSLEKELANHKDGEFEVDRLEKQFRIASDEFEVLEKQTQKVLGDMAKADKEGVKLEERRKFLFTKRKKAEASHESSNLGSREAQTLLKQHSSDIERNNESIALLEQQISIEEIELHAIRDSLQGKTQGLSDEIAVKQQSLQPWNEKINQNKSAKAVAESELDIMRERGNAGTYAAAELSSKIEGLAESKAVKEAELEECARQKTDTLGRIKRIQAELVELTSKQGVLQPTVSDARQKANEANASLSASQTQGNVLTGLMRLKHSGRINGFHGRLGNLGTIEAKYDIAISTACPALENMVVDSVEVGQQCIEYLRKNNLGRANFILLNRLAKRDLSRLATPENVPRLFDLIKTKEDRFRPAFFSVLQNTLVANDLEQANRIAYGAKRWRVVTLDGKLIDKSGTMTGGGTRVAKGGMSSVLTADVTKDQVTKLEFDRDALEQKLQEYLKQHQNMKENLTELKSSIPKLETRSQKIVLEINSIGKNIADAEKRLLELSAEQRDSKADKARLVVLEQTIKTADQKIIKLHQEMASIEEEIKALQDKIMEIGGIRLRTQKAKVDGLKQQIDTLTEEVSSWEMNKAKAEKSLQKHHKTYADVTKDLTKIAQELEKLEGDVKQHHDSTAKSQQQISQAENALESKKEELAAVKDELDAKMCDINESRGAEIEIRNRLQEAQKTLEDAQKRLSHWQEKLGKLTIQPLAEFGVQEHNEGLAVYSRDELLGMDKDSLKHEIESLETKLEKVKVDLNVLAEYRRRVEEHAARSATLSEAVTRRDAAKKHCDELRRLRLEGFMQGFSCISLRLKEMYQMITMGGNAELELVDSLDPFSEGILFSVMPPKKSWKNISNLSGGEKTLSSLALVFALHHYKPTPLYVMDEIDAALDFRNVSIVASYIKERTKNAQFIVISLRNNMFELATRLVGVYKVNHMTKSVTIENQNYLTTTPT